MPALVEEDRLQVMLTPIQLAALLQQASLQRLATMANRFWGALGLIGGAVDLVATVPLWLAPKPISKVTAGAIDYVGADVVSTGLRQVWTGRRQVTLTAEVVDRLLRSLGVDPSVASQLSRNTYTAMNMTALIATPLSVANAARAARVTSGRTRSHRPGGRGEISRRAHDRQAFGTDRGRFALSACARARSDESVEFSNSGGLVGHDRGGDCGEAPPGRSPCQLLALNVRAYRVAARA